MENEVANQFYGQGCVTCAYRLYFVYGPWESEIKTSDLHLFLDMLTSSSH